MSTASRDKVSNQLFDYSALKKSDFSNQSELTTSNGAPVDSITASTTAGSKGPIVLKVILRYYKIVIFLI
jgi:catalase